MNKILTLFNKSFSFYRFALLRSNIQSLSYSKAVAIQTALIKPKKPLTPFMKYAQEQRPILLKKHPDKRIPGIMKIISSQWQELDNQKKDILKNVYEKEISDYKKRKETFDASLTSEEKENIKKVRIEKSRAKAVRKLKAAYKKFGRPKRPVSSFFLFRDSERHLLKKMTMIEFNKYMANKWKNISQEEKAEWNKKEQEMWLAYRKDLYLWEEKMCNLGNFELVRRKSFKSTGAKTKKLKTLKQESAKDDLHKAN